MSGMSISELTEKAINAIIRPPRKTYNPLDLPIFFTAADGRKYIRHPLNFRNKRHQKIVGSLYVMEGVDAMSNIPCVLYLHGNASSQYEGQFLVPNLCPYNIAVYCFDFAGCGASDGEYISLGYYETQDIELILTSLTNSFQFCKYILWGRSMGAACSILVNHPQLVGRVCDSTFTSINEVCSAIASSMGVPSLLISPALWYLKFNVSNKADFNMNSVVPEEQARKDMPVPLIVGHAVDDEFIPIEQGRRVFEAYCGEDKEFVALNNGHNGKRTREWIMRACRMCFRCFGITAEGYQPTSFTGFSDNGVPHFSSFMEMVAASNAKKKEDQKEEEEQSEEEDTKEEVLEEEDSVPAVEEKTK
jgi:pimeloyl-ACP methyl ester carboxylesterase